MARRHRRTAVPTLEPESIIVKSEFEQDRPRALPDGNRVADTLWRCLCFIALLSVITACGRNEQSEQPAPKATSAPLLSCKLVEKFKAVETCAEHAVALHKGRGTFRFSKRYALPPYISAAPLGNDRVNFNETAQAVTFLITDASGKTDTSVSRKLHFIVIVHNGI